MPATPPPPSFTELFTPKLVTVLREGYGRKEFTADVIAGLTVAIVALPLSMAIAIASGVTPDRGLYAAIIGGVLVSALGGSRHQIGGPAGAFIVLVAACVLRHGVEGLLTAVFLSGLMLLAIGLLRLGTYIKFIPYPVTVGFTAGIAVIIFASQIKDLFGLRLSGPEPSAIWPKLQALWAASSSVSPAAVGIAVLTIGLILGIKRLKASLPNLLIAVVAASLVAWVFGLPVETIGTRFGGIPHALPAPALPDLSLARIQAVLPEAIAFALLGAIESLLSAVVADGMTGRRHRSNCELVAQGVANIGSSLFGGICVTGTIARTATNIRSGAIGPVAGILHALFLLGFMLVAAPLASFIPLAALAGILATVAWNMAERHEFAVLLRASRGDALVLMSTFLLTVFRDLTEGIVVGFALGALLFIHRMSEQVALEAHGHLIDDDRADTPGSATGLIGQSPAIVTYRLSGAFFFGAASTVGAVLDRIDGAHRAFILDMAAVPFLDSTAAKTIAASAASARKRGVLFIISGAAAAVRTTLAQHGAGPPLVAQADDLATAQAEAAAMLAGRP